MQVIDASVHSYAAQARLVEVIVSVLVLPIMRGQVSYLVISIEKANEKQSENIAKAKTRQ